MTGPSPAGGSPRARAPFRSGWPTTPSSLEDGEVRPICAALWTLTATPGAIAIVIALEHERRRVTVARAEIRLTEHETAIFHRAQSLALGLRAVATSAGRFRHALPELRLRLGDACVPDEPHSFPLR